ncbi:MAG: cell division topological specificity factor MinE [Proteobacteria bacterium]|nr:cell division topological specificity factor MinE [Pseudomonadota bacterium]
MGIFDFLKPRQQSASTAKNRLQVIIAEQRSEAGAPDFLPRLRQELIEVIRKYVHVPEDSIKVEKVRHNDYDILDISVELPDMRPGADA